MEDERRIISYKLKKDLPTISAGVPFTWNGEEWEYKKERTEWYFRHDEVMANPDWFEPVYLQGDVSPSVPFPYNLKRGDRVLVWDEATHEYERIFLAYIDDADKPFICVAGSSENLFNEGQVFPTTEWRDAKPVPVQEPIVELSLKEIAEKLNIKPELLRIKE